MRGPRESVMWRHFPRVDRRVNQSGDDRRDRSRPDAGDHGRPRVSLHGQSQSDFVALIASVLQLHFDTALRINWITFRTSSNTTRSAVWLKRPLPPSIHMPAERPLAGPGPERAPKRAPMRTRAHNQAESSAPPAPSPVSPQRLSRARGVVVGIFLGLLAWAFLFFLLRWLLA